MPIEYLIVFLQLSLICIWPIVCIMDFPFRQMKQLKVIFFSGGLYLFLGNGYKEVWWKHHWQHLYSVWSQGNVYCKVRLQNGKGEIRAISYKESVWSHNLDLNSPMRHWFLFKFRHVRRLSKGMFIGWEPKFTLSCFSKKATVLGRDCQQYSIRSYRVFCTTFLWKVNSKQKKKLMMHIWIIIQ